MLFLDSYYFKSKRCKLEPQAQHYYTAHCMVSTFPFQQAWVDEYVHELASKRPSLVSLNVTRTFDSRQHTGTSFL
jgi:hypothetical protein